jgi:hypothetical protein
MVLRSLRLKVVVVPAEHAQRLPTMFLADDEFVAVFVVPHLQVIQ